MARIKRAAIRKTRTRKLFGRSKGFFGARKNTRRQANEAVMHARANAYRGCKEKKRQFRALWITWSSDKPDPKSKCVGFQMSSNFVMVGSTKAARTL